MKWWKAVGVAVLLLMPVALFAAQEVCVADQPPQVGGQLPDITLPAPQNPDESGLLGVKPQGAFKIPQIQAQIVILEVFSMYCPYCQREAPKVNELFQIIAGREDLQNKIKLIGIGAGNSPYEVKLFKDQYHVSFPLFPDEDLAIHKALGQVRTPYFIGVRINADGSHRVVYSKLGSIGDPKRFLETLLQQSTSQ
jgi:peroxiredoxin